MITFTVNGKQITADPTGRLLAFLRDELRLTGAKDGCSEGACGTCMVLVDGKAQKACLQRMDRMEGKQVVTIEGLSEREKQIYGYAFAKAGAVQCGFCIPGMVISAKGLLDQNPSPSRDDVKKAIKPNICRCTGYKKIVDAVLLAASLFASGSLPDASVGDGHVGAPMPRTDATAKTLGQAEYADDIYLPGMVHASAVRSAYPRARIVSIDTSAAQAAPGVLCVLTAADIPGQRNIGHVTHDWDAMIAAGEITRYAGDSLALVAAETKEQLAAAKALVQVEYEPLTPMENPQQALAEGAPKIHAGGNVLSEEHLTRGDVEAAIQGAAHVVTRHYSTPFTEHAFLEPETAVAVPQGDGVTIYSGDQGVYQTRKECALLLGLPEEKVRVIAKMVGGGFGGKEDMSVQHHAALAAVKCGRPVKVSLSRQESILVHPKRHPMEMDITTACDENGMLLGMKAVIVSDTGAYASLGKSVLQRACTHAAGPYNYQNIDIRGTAVYTNNPPAGPYRGFGVTQSCFAAESNLNLLAEMVGISPFEIRYRNAIRPGQTLPNGQIAGPDTALVETLDAVRPVYEANPGAGIACAMKNAGIGVGIPDTGRCRLRVQQGRVYIQTSAACIGQGMGTVVTQIVCDTAGLSPDVVVHEQPDTGRTPNSGNTTASRQTVFTGEATRKAALLLREKLSERSLSQLENSVFEGEYTSTTDPMGSPKENPVSHVNYGYATHLVTLDENGHISRFLAAHDVGRAINPANIEGQIEGGVVMSLGYALTEDFPLKGCIPKVKFGTLGLMKSTDVPEVEAIIIEKNKENLACGAKGIGEICSIPTAPAVALAYYLRDGKFRTSLPLADTPYSRKQ